MSWYNHITGLNRTLDTVSNHSFKIKTNQTLAIEFIDVPEELMKQTLHYFAGKNIKVLYQVKYQDIINTFAENYNSDYYAMIAKNEIHQLKKADFLLGMRAIHNTNDFGSIAPEKKDVILKNYLKPVHYEYRNNYIPWVYLRIPTASMAQHAEMSTLDFIDYYYKTMNLNYQDLRKSLEPLKDLMNQTNTTRITAPGTDLEFTKKNKPVIIDDGTVNLPDGEVRSVPDLESVNGTIRFNTPSTYYGVTYNSISLSFQEGKIIQAKTLKNQKELNAILDTDKGSRYLGEFAMGMNPLIHSPINDILFDEKIFGSIHLAIGNALSTCDNGNRSAIHWDLILNLNKDWGGGQLFFDEKLVFDSGKFVTPELERLNDLKDNFVH